MNWCESHLFVEDINFYKEVLCWYVMNNYHTHYGIKGPVDGEMLRNVVDQYRAKIGPTIQGHCGAFMISEDPNVSNRSNMSFGGRSIVPIFGKDSSGSVLSLEGFLRQGCNIDHFDHFALLFGTRASPEVEDTDFGCGASAIYVSHLNLNRSVVSVPYPSGEAYAKNCFLNAAGVREDDEIKSGWLPLLPRLRVA